jgi:hypothetical protein
MCTSSGYTEKTSAMFLTERAELDAIERIDAMSLLQKREVGLTRADEQDVRHRSRGRLDRGPGVRVAGLGGDARDRARDRVIHPFHRAGGDGDGAARLGAETRFMA